MPTTDAAALAVVNFWREAGPERWFRKNPAFDDDFRRRFLELHERAARGELNDWLRTAEGALALILLLDQFPRNCFRGTRRMYATDPLARQTARRAIEAGLDTKVSPELRVFLYLPFSHSEDLSDQDFSVAKQKALGEEYQKHAVEHRDIVAKFGRFPHRNTILGRRSSAEEEAFLKDGGFSG